MGEFRKSRSAAQCLHRIQQESSCLNILDPGLGFFISAEARYSFEIVRRLPELKALGFPLLLGPSRKSFLAGVSSGKTLSTEERLIPGVALSAIAAWLGVDILRTHDVQAGRLLLDTVRVLRSTS